MNQDQPGSPPITAEKRLEMELRNGVTVLTARLQMTRRRANREVNPPPWLAEDLERLEAAAVRLVQLLRTLEERNAPNR